MSREHKNKPQEHIRNFLWTSAEFSTAEALLSCPSSALCTWGTRPQPRQDTQKLTWEHRFHKEPRKQIPDPTLMITSQNQPHTRPREVERPVEATPLVRWPGNYRAQSSLDLIITISFSLSSVCLQDLIFGHVLLHICALGSLGHTDSRTVCHSGFWNPPAWSNPYFHRVSEAT